MEDIFHTMLIASRSVQFRAPNGAALGWRPPIDVYEAEDALHIVVELAGVAEDQIEVAVDDDILTIRGVRAPLHLDPQHSIHELGILRGHFAADIYLPVAVDKRQVEAVYENGMLRIRLARIEPTKIAINRERGAAVPDGSGR
jgi:HSP20 family molecular chaperone IbpA